MVLRLKLDENLPQRAEQALRGLAGAEDPNLLSACIAEDRILVTLDLDFSDIREYPPGSHRGVWVLRPAQQ